MAASPWSGTRLRVDAVEEAPALGRGLGPEPVHGGGEPEDAGDGAERGLGGGLAVDLDLTAGAFGPGGDLVAIAPGLEGGGDLPAEVLGGAGHLLGGGAAQAAPGGEERDGLDEVGLAGAVRAEDRDRAGVEREAGAAVGAEVREAEAGDGEGAGHAEPGSARDKKDRAPAQGARRNVAQAPFHLISTLFGKYTSKYTSRDISSRAHAQLPASRSWPGACDCSGALQTRIGMTT